MATHTPGPWGAIGSETSEGAPFWSVYGADEKAIIYATLRAHNELAANARLIAASPELLDLAYQYLSDLRRPPTGDSLQRRIERAEAIIAKATGA
jgi:hypothetical protein